MCVRVRPHQAVFPEEPEPIRQRAHVYAMPVMRNREVNWGVRLYNEHTWGSSELQSRSSAEVCVGLSAGLQSNQGGIVKCGNGNLRNLKRV